MAATSAAAQEAPPAIPVEPVEAQQLAPPPAREFHGPAIVLDSTTIAIGGDVLTLYGLVPIRTDWRLEAAARSALDDLTQGTDVNCIEAGRDRHRRLLATCTAAEFDLGEAMLAAGMALVDRAVTRQPDADTALADRYDAAERTARDGSAGLWAMVPGYQPVEPAPPPPGLWDQVERFQAGIAMLAGMIVVALAILATGRRRR
jgi:endonuclease YncB( thermonuclease family)